MKDAQKNKILAVTGMSEIGFIAEGLESSQTGYIVSEDGLSRIAEALEQADAAAQVAEANAARITELEGQLQQANEARTTAENSLSAVQTELQTAQARVTELEEEGSISQTRKTLDNNGREKLKAHENPQNSINRYADNFFGNPEFRKVSQEQEQDLD